MNTNDTEISIDPRDCYDRVIVFDTETTGLKANPDHILSIAAFEIIDGKLTGKQFECYFRPRVQISKGASKVHGLYDSFYEEYFNDCFNSDKNKLISFLSFVDNSNLVAYNAQFDCSFLNYELNYWGLSEIPKSKFVCCMRMFRSIVSQTDSTIKGNVSLKKSSNYLGIKPLKEEFHSALFDAFICARILIKLLYLVQKKPHVEEAGVIKKDNLVTPNTPEDKSTPEATLKRTTNIKPYSAINENLEDNSRFDFGEIKSVMNNLLNIASSSDK